MTVFKRWVLPLGMALLFVGAAWGQEASEKELVKLLTRINQIDGMLAYNKLVRDAATQAFSTLSCPKA